MARLASTPHVTIKVGSYLLAPFTHLFICISVDVVIAVDVEDVATSGPSSNRSTATPNSKVGE